MARRSKAQIRKTYSKMLGEDLVAKLSDEQISIISKYYNSLSGDESSNLDSRMMMGYSDTVLHEMARDMIDENDVSKEEDLDDLLKSIRSEKEGETERKTFENKLGKDVVSKLSDDQIKKLSEYYNSLPPKEREKTDKEIAKKRGEFFDIARGMAGIKFIELNENEKQKFTPDAVEVEQGPILPPKEEGGDVYSERKKFNTAKFFDNDEYDDYYKELVNEGSIDDQNLSADERQRGIAAFRSNKLDFKKFVTDIQSFKPEVERLNQEPLTIREQFFTAPKIEPSKLIPSEDVEISEEFSEKLDELIAVIKEDNKLEEESQKLENRESQREKRKKREDRIENRKQTKLFSTNLKKGSGKISNFFDDLKRFLTFAVLGGLVGTLYNFIMNPENDEKIKATQNFLKDYWPALLAGAAYFLTPLGGLVNFLVKTIGGFALRLGALMIKHPLLAAALGVTAATVALADRTKKASEQIIEREEEKAGREFTPKEQAETLSKPSSILETFTRRLLPSLNEKPQEDTVEGRSGGGLIESGDNILGFTGGGFNMGTDTVPALLTPGEIVINKPTVDAVGAEPFLALNKQFGGANANRPKVGKVMGFQGGGFVISPEERRMLDAISGAEGTKGYGTLYGGRNIPELAKGEMTINQVLNMQETGRYKGKSVYAGGKYASAATGRYQFMPDVLREEANRYGYDLNKTKFTPKLQDELIIRRIRRKRDVTPELLKSEGMSDNVIDMLAPEFASFPNLFGPDAKGRYGTNSSYYGQGGKSAEFIRGLYDKSDAHLSKSESIKTGAGSLGPAFESNNVINQNQLIMNNLNETKKVKSNPLETFVFEPLRRALSVGTPNIPTETRNFMMPPVETPKQNQSTNQTGDVPSFNISSGNRMRDLVSKDLGIRDLVGAS